jgi:hypothetical protein
MVRGPKKHMKRLNAPSHWMLDKLGGIFVSHWVAGAGAQQALGAQQAGGRARRAPPIAWALRRRCLQQAVRRS